MYATTRQFLDHFGLSRLDQLPSLGEIRDLDDINPQLGLEGDDDRSVGSVDSQAEISFSSMAYLILKSSHTRAFVVLRSEEKQQEFIFQFKSKPNRAIGSNYILSRNSFRHLK
jgi:hypothetical protein